MVNRRLRSAGNCAVTAAPWSVATVWSEMIATRYAGATRSTTAAIPATVPAPQYTGYGSGRVIMAWGA